jgi:hypothetical protein
MVFQETLNPWFIVIIGTVEGVDKGPFADIPGVFRVHSNGEKGGRAVEACG